MEYRVELMRGFQVIGFSKVFDEKHSYQEIPHFWEDIFQKYSTHPIFGNAIQNFRIGEFGICLDELGSSGKFTYMIAGEYLGGIVPEGLCTFAFPEMMWAKFRCVGPLPYALQEMNTRIFTDWLPNNQVYELAKGCSVEWYSDAKNTQSGDYVSEIWVPIKKKSS